MEFEKNFEFSMCSSRYVKKLILVTISCLNRLLWFLFSVLFWRLSISSEYSSSLLSFSSLDKFVLSCSKIIYPNLFKYEYTY